MEAIGVATATIAQVSAAASTIAHVSVTVGQGGLSNLQRVKAHHSSTFRGGGDPMIAYHWFRQVEKILEAMEIISNATKIKIWWDWVKASRNLEAMTWEEFRELFKSKFFPAST